ncbi:MAG: type II CAAX endopeptidase family protein [Rikenellaceae bacterium]
MQESIEGIVQDEAVKRPKSNFPTIIDLLAILGIFLLSQVIGLMVAYGLGYTIDAAAINSGDDLLARAAEYQLGWFTLISYLVVMGITILFTIFLRLLRGVRGVRMVRFSYLGLNPTLLLWGIILLLLISVALDPLISIMPSPPEIKGRGVGMILSLLVAAPILEEFLCRGIILESVRRKWGLFVACILSSLFFAVLHMHPTQIINAFVVGLLLSYLYVRTNSIFAPILLHAFNNGLAFLLIYIGYGDVTLMDLVGNRELYNMIYYPSLVLLLISMCIIARRLAHMEREQKEKSMQ